MLKLLLIDLGLINIRLKDIKEDIDESLGAEFTKGKNSHIFSKTWSQKPRKLKKASLNGTRNYKNALKMHQKMPQKVSSKHRKKQMKAEEN